MIPAWLQVSLEVNFFFFLVTLYYQQPGEMQGFGSAGDPQVLIAKQF